MREILREVRWELDLRGYQDVKLFASGGLDEETILTLNEYADAYGVGTAISNAPVINFGMDIVEIEGIPISKRGKMSGRKKLVRCFNCRQTSVVPATRAIAPCPCGGDTENLLAGAIENGRIAVDLQHPSATREYVLSQYPTLELP